MKVKDKKLKWWLMAMGIVLCLASIYLFTVNFSSITARINGDYKKIKVFFEITEEHIKYYEVNNLNFDVYTAHVPKVNSHKKESDNRFKMLSKPEKKNFDNLSSDIKNTIIYCNSSDSAYADCKKYFNSKRENKYCEEHEKQITELYKIAASIKEKDISQELIKLVDMLRDRQVTASCSKIIKLQHSIFSQIACISEQGYIMQHAYPNGVDNEPSPEYQGMLHHLTEREKCLESLAKFNEEKISMQKLIETKDIIINDYLSILKGKLDNIGRFHIR